jgi:hypothetical protein
MPAVVSLGAQSQPQLLAILRTYGYGSPEADGQSPSSSRSASAWRVAEANSTESRLAPGRMCW